MLQRHFSENRQKSSFFTAILMMKTLFKHKINTITPSTSYRVMGGNNMAAKNVNRVIIINTE